MVNLLAQLSQRLIGELKEYPRYGVCPSFSLKPPSSDLDIYSQTGFFGHVFCQKVYNRLQSYQLFFLLFEHLCVSDMQNYPAQKS